MGQMENGSVNVVLSNLAQGYTNSSFISDMVLPVVEVQKEGVKIPKFKKEHFRAVKTERAIRSGSNRLNWEFDTPTETKLTEHDLEFPIDQREIDENADVVSLNNHGVNVTTESIRLQLEISAAAAIQNASNYTSSNALEITSPDDKWSDSGSDILGQIEDGKEQVRSNIAHEPNIAVFGAKAWRYFRTHPAVRELIKYSNIGVVSKELAAQLLDVDEVIVGKGIVFASNNTASDIWGDMLCLAYRTNTPVEARTIYEPSFGYTIRKRGYPLVDEGTENRGKLKIIRNTDIVTNLLCGTDAAYLLHNLV